MKKVKKFRGSIFIGMLYIMITRCLLEAPWLVLLLPLFVAYGLGFLYGFLYGDAPIRKGV